MEEQRRILEAQIAEAQERKKMEKEKEKLDDILDEVRVKSELGIIDVDKKRKAQLTKSVAEEQDKLNRAQQEVLKRKGLISNMTSPDRQQAVSISHVLILCIFKCGF
jgi:formate-dependent nitrite reductase cytochrome c552 subunit